MNDERKDILDKIDSMTDDIDDAYGDLEEATNAFGEEQLLLQDEQTNYTVEQIEQQKEEAKNELQKEQKNAYADYQKQVNPYGVEAEQMAQMGMSNTGYSETSKVAMYTAHQNRIALAKQSYDKAILDYNNAINEARMQNSVSKAQIAFQTLQMRLGYVIEGIGKKMSMLQTKADTIGSQKSYLDILDELNSGGAEDNLNGVNQPNGGAEVNLNGAKPTNDTLYELPEGMQGPVRLTDEEIANIMPHGGNKAKENIAFIKENGITSEQTAKQLLSEAGIDPTGHIMAEQQWNQLKNTQPDDFRVNGIESYHDYLTFITLWLLEQSL